MTETKHQPATALPWRTVASYQPQTRKEEMSPYVLGADGENVAASALRGVDDAAYIAHAANAYPKLVEVLRACIRADNLRAFERGQREPEFQHSADHPARAILRDLGEIE